MQNGKGILSRKLVIYILSLSSIVTLFTTLYQLSHDYHEGKSAIDKGLTQIERSFSASIATHLWDFSSARIEVAFEGILQMPYISYVSVSTELNQNISRGKKREENFVEKNIPLFHKHEDKTVKVGTLKLQASLMQLYDSLLTKIVIIFFSQLIKTLIITSMMFVIFQHLIVIPLLKIVNYTSNLQFSNLNKEFNLQRKPNFFNSFDELDLLAKSINDMRAKLNSTYHDLSGHKEHLEEIVKERTKELTLINTELTSYGHTIAHDLKNPIGVIKSYIEILKEDDNLDAKESESILSSIYKSVDQALSIIEGLLTHAKKGGNIQLTAIDLTDAFNLSLAQLKNQIEASGANIIAQFGPTHFKGNLITTTQIITNILDNSIKYAHPERRAQIVVKTSLHENHLVLAIEDNGRGMRQEELTSIFETFSRANETSEQIKGHGIGLATVKKLVEANNATIQVKSTLGQGTEFIICFETQMPSESAVA